MYTVPALEGLWVHLRFFRFEMFVTHHQIYHYFVQFMVEINNKLLS